MEIVINNLSALNPLAVAASTFAILIIGFLWVSQPLFGRAFTRLSGIRPGDMRAEHFRNINIVRWLTAFISAILIGILHTHIGKDSSVLIHSIVFIWLFIMLNQLNGFTFRREPFALFLLTTIRTLLTLLAGAAVFILWK